MIETATPQYEHLNARYANMEHLTYARLICPLAEDGSTVDGVVGFIGFDVA